MPMVQGVVYALLISWYVTERLFTGHSALPTEQIQVAALQHGSEVLWSNHGCQDTTLVVSLMDASTI